MKRAQATPITVIIVMMLVTALYSIALAPVLGTFISAKIADGTLTGLEAFIAANYNVFMFILFFVITALGVRVSNF